MVINFLFFFFFLSFTVMYFCVVYVGSSGKHFINFRKMPFCKIKVLQWFNMHWCVCMCVRDSIRDGNLDGRIHVMSRLTGCETYSLGDKLIPVHTNLLPMWEHLKAWCITSKSFCHFDDFSEDCSFRLFNTISFSFTATYWQFQKLAIKETFSKYNIPQLEV